MSQLETLINTSDENLLTLLSSLCQGAIAIDQECRIVWLSQQYRELMELPDNTEFIGQLVNDILPTTQLPRILKTGQPSFLDLMQINNQWCAVTRLPLKNPDGSVFGAIGFVFYDNLENLQPLFDKFARLKKQLVSENLLRISKYELDDLVGNSPALLKIKRQALRAAQLDTTILLLGETGTGKELLAQGIHNASPRRDAPFVGINMAALPESLVEAELFGTAAGAYTGANKNGRLGKIQLATGGTLFLDEIADISAAIQAKLLRVIQEREIEALGSNRLEKVDVRIIAATSRNLKQLVDKGLFRADLYYRLNVLPLQLPALRDRIPDIPAISSYLMEKIARESGLPALSLSKDALIWLQQYHWPGNVRELHNRLERACVMAEQELISTEDLGAEDLISTNETIAFTDLNQAKNHAEAESLQQALTQSQHNKTKAAKLLGISRATLYNRIKRLNM
ncbi:sigma-54 interaction domain-containing protein [Amphritea japonica]|uniref:Fis family transcriptional regulator n=1 Tax=Amphritea japonica ATCC BAA-1530 TaxID=1278309 RepID=A0A7R6P5C2_9GAMM|nr:sigma 54-interacting transcriptional regulator [Amphritea japonica]BBB27514.1 Fis family transcriptional regulator [Amphritea japonica ATCC BAA-1530]